MSFALIAARYTVSNAPTICASTVSGGVGKANGVGIGAIVLWASGCLACCSDVRVAVCSGATLAVCCGTAVGVFCAAGERFGFAGRLPALKRAAYSLFPLASP